MNAEHTHEHHHHHHHEPHRVHLKIVTLSGNFSHEFNVHDRLQLVVDETLKHLHIIPAEGEVWILSLHDRDVDLKKTIEQEHIPNDATLKLAAKEGGGGAQWTPKSAR
jgi:hypothetical protein